MAVQTEGNVKKGLCINSSHDIMKEQFTSGHDEDHSVLSLMIMWLHYVQHETKCYSEVASQLSVSQEPTVSKPQQSFMLSLTENLVQLFGRQSLVGQRIQFKTRDFKIRSIWIYKKNYFSVILSQIFTSQTVEWKS